MRKPTFIAWLAAGSILLTAGCSRAPAVDSSLPAAVPAAVRQIQRDEEARAAAGALLRQQGWEWGEPQQYRRTVSNWYRVEYAPDSAGHERVVLVNPDNGQAEFPLPR